ncbi:hypothetical protein GEV33_003960 [Tenebrio molitor]|uniref:Uncharacterized protein n=1 Tax=Tenebrio molitor TaxID=7067 RepID=A0A8J6HRU0_TENMO|nr:hypothetical protein GEV33_003960 [Tenebrio molitor]
MYSSNILSWQIPPHTEWSFVSSRKSQWPPSLSLTHPPSLSPSRRHNLIYWTHISCCTSDGRDSWELLSIPFVHLTPPNPPPPHNNKINAPRPHRREYKCHLQVNPWRVERRTAWRHLYAGILAPQRDAVAGNEDERPGDGAFDPVHFQPAPGSGVAPEDADCRGKSPNFGTPLYECLSGASEVWESQVVPCTQSISNQTSIKPTLFARLDYSELYSARSLETPCLPTGSDKNCALTKGRSGFGIFIDGRPMEGADINLFLFWADGSALDGLAVASQYSLREEPRDRTEMEGTNGRFGKALTVFAQ